MHSPINTTKAQRSWCTRVLRHRTLKGAPSRPVSLAAPPANTSVAQPALNKRNARREAHLGCRGCRLRLARGLLLRLLLFRPLLIRLVCLIFLLRWSHVLVITLHVARDLIVNRFVLVLLLLLADPPSNSHGDLTQCIVEDGFQFVVLHNSSC